MLVALEDEAVDDDEGEPVGVTLGAGLGAACFSALTGTSLLKDGLLGL
jgi:hypothetical protein